MSRMVVPPRNFASGIVKMKLPRSKIGLVAALLLFSGVATGKALNQPKPPSMRSSRRPSAR
jgi:hypothetical protein